MPAPADRAKRLALPSRRGPATHRRAGGPERARRVRAGTDCAKRLALPAAQRPENTAANNYASRDSMISSETSKLAKTFWTSSQSSRASIRRVTLVAPSTSTSTVRVGTNDASAES